MPGYDIINETVIDASPEAVWTALVAELSGAAQWWVPANTFRIGALPPDQVGGESHVTVHTKGVDKGGPKLRFTSRTSDVERHRRLAGEYVDGAFRGTNEFLLVPLDDGRTLLSMRFCGRPHGVLALLAKVADIGAEHAAATQAAFERLAAILGVRRPAPARAAR